MKKNFLSFFLFIACLSGSSQIDTCFWFAAPWVTPDHAFRHPIRVHISTFAAPTTTVRLRQPAAIAPNKYDTTIVIGAYSTFDFTFWRDASCSVTNIAYDSLESRPADQVLPYGLYFSSSSNINLVYDIVTTGNNPETFSLKGRNALGTHFLCPQQNKLLTPSVTNLANTPPGVMQPKQQINIVASQANTTVSITPKCAIVGHPANTTYTILLVNPGDVYTIENLVQNTNVVGNNLSGTEITSSKPIAVTIADDSVKGLSGGCRDLIGDQITPIAVTGLEYILVKGLTFPGEAEGAYILATQNTTSITINDGIVTTTVINKGDTYFYQTNQLLTYVTADKKIYCLQMTGNGCELGEDQLPPLSCAGSTLVSFSRNTNQNFYLHIVCKASAINSFTLNNNSSSVSIPITAANFTVVPGTAGQYYGAQLSLTSATALPIGSYTIANNIDVFALGVFDGGIATGGLFHYMSSFLNNTYVSATGNQTYMCVGSNNNTVALTGNVSGAALTGTWTTLNGTGTFGSYTSTLTTVSTTYSLSNSDTLLSSIKFYLTSIGSCNPKVDSVIITIYQRPQIGTIGNFTTCSSQASIALTGTVINALNGVWSGGNGGSFGGPGPVTSYTPSIADQSAGSATFALTSQSVSPGCINASKSLTVTFISSPTISAVSNPFTICVGQTATITPSGASSYTISGNNFVVSPITTTGYSISGTNSLNCTSSSIAIVIVTVHPIPNVIASVNPTLICIGQQASLTASGATAYGWNPFIPSNGIVSPSITTIYTVQGVSSFGCAKNVTVSLVVDPCTVIEEISLLEKITILPNPSNGIFKVQLADLADAEVEVKNNLGQIILFTKISQSQNVIDLTKNAIGVYYVKVKNGNKERIIKVIKE